ASSTTWVATYLRGPSTMHTATTPTAAAARAANPCRYSVGCSPKYWDLRDPWQRIDRPGLVRRDTTSRMPLHCGKRYTTISKLESERNVRVGDVRHFTTGLQPP